MSKISVGLIVLKIMPLESSLARRDKRLSDGNVEAAVVKLTDTFSNPDIPCIENKIVFKVVQEKLRLLNNYKSCRASKLRNLSLSLTLPK
jgi:hypothetical protein